MTKNNLQNRIDDQEEPSKSLEMDQIRAMESISYKQIQNNIVDYKLLILLSSKLNKIYLLFFTSFKNKVKLYANIKRKTHIIILDLYVQHARNQ